MNLPPGVESLDDLGDHASRRFTTTAVTISTVALLLYEYATTFEMEVLYIWQATPRVTLTNVLFYINRYFPIMRAIFATYFALNPPSNPRTCSRFTDINSWSVMICMAVVEVLMLLRAWAVWGQRRTIGIALVSLWLCAVIASVVIVKSHITAIHGVIQLPPKSVFRCDRPSPNKYFAEYLVALWIELVSLGFMFGRVAFISKGARRKVPIVKALQTQGSYYFMAVISVMVFTIVSSCIDKLVGPVVYSGFTPTITSIACNRVILALRGLFLNPESETPTPALLPTPNDPLAIMKRLDSNYDTLTTPSGMTPCTSTNQYSYRLGRTGFSSYFSNKMDPIEFTQFDPMTQFSHYDSGFTYGIESTVGRIPLRDEEEDVEQTDLGSPADVTPLRIAQGFGRISTASSYASSRHLETDLEASSPLSQY